MTSDVPAQPDLFPLLARKSLASPDPMALNLQVGLMVTGAVSAAVKLRLAEHLGATAKTIDELADETQSHAPSLYLLMRALAGIGIFEERDEQTHTFGNTERSLLLLPDRMGNLVRLWSADYQWESWRDLVYTIQTGKPAIAKRYEEDANIWTYLNEHPEDNFYFQQGLAVNARLIIPTLLETYDFSRYRHVVDVGGGHGALSVSLLHHYSDLNVTLFDRATVIELVQQTVTHALPEHTAARFSLVTGDFFEAVPEGDCHIIKNVLMDWSDDDYLRILRACHRAIATSGHLLVLEPVLSVETPFTKFFSLQMAMMMHAARHRTLAEHQALFAAAGFALTEAIPLGLEQMLLVGAVTPMADVETSLAGS